MVDLFSVRLRRTTSVELVENMHISFQENTFENEILKIVILLNAPCVKHYLTAHVQQAGSPFTEIDWLLSQHE